MASSLHADSAPSSQASRMKISVSESAAMTVARTSAGAERTRATTASGPVPPKATARAPADVDRAGRVGINDPTRVSSGGRQRHEVAAHGLGAVARSDAGGVVRIVDVAVVVVVEAVGAGRGDHGFGLVIVGAGRAARVREVDRAVRVGISPVVAGANEREHVDGEAGCVPPAADAHEVRTRLDLRAQRRRPKERSVARELFAADARLLEREPRLGTGGISGDGELRALLDLHRVDDRRRPAAVAA